MQEKLERLAEIIDSVDSLAHGLNTPVSAQFHVDQLKVLLPQKVADLKAAYVELSGDNPWD